MTDQPPVSELEPYSREMYLAVISAVPNWMTDRITSITRSGVGAVPKDMASEMPVVVGRVEHEIERELLQLLVTDVDEQRQNPLHVLRSCVGPATELMQRYLVPMPMRDEFETRSMPHDVYAIGPLTWKDLGEEVHEAGITWGAWKAAAITRDEVIVSWLPLYHDMGLVGLLTIPMTIGCTLVQGAPQDFLARPLRWMQWISQYGGTGTAGPNFSYSLAARAMRRTEEDLDLSHMRVWLNGAEPVDPETFRSFFTAGEKFRLSPKGAFPAFGMAEVCIAGCFPEPMAGLLTDWVDKSALESRHLAIPVEPGVEGATELVLLGKAVPGLEIAIVDCATGEICGDRQVGELKITGNSLTSGYYEQPAETEELIIDGWLHTGDLAYTIDGSLVVCGRIKDVIIVGGRNVFPQDIEKVAGEVEGARTGNVIAFGIEGRQGAQNIIVVAEARAADLAEVARVIQSVVTDSVGIPPKQVILVEPGTVPKTSSGKLQRSACRQQFIEGTLAVLDLS